MMRYKKKNRAAYTIDATTTSKDWGFHPVPLKGGKTTNYDSGLPDPIAKISCYGRKR